MSLVQVTVISYLMLEPHLAVGVLILAGVYLRLERHLAVRVLRVAGGFIRRSKMVSDSIYIALVTNKIVAVRIEIIQIGIITHIKGSSEGTGTWKLDLINLLASSGILEFTVS